MSAETLIKLENVGKQFSKGFEHSHRTLGHELTALFFGAKPPAPDDDPQAFWALKGIDFEVRRGEVLGVIGHNGAGKTTLLRMLNGEVPHDCGEMLVRGRRSSLIDLTGGFTTTMTGRENIYFRGAHLGFDRAFLQEKEQEILDFAELGDFVDSPIKNYSSGMLLRLGFAVTVFAEPDVLLVDEILSVGDFLFQQKCMNRINRLREKSAVVIVSHGMSTITAFADKCLLLDRGAPVFLGKPVQAVEAYYRLEAEKEKHGARLSRAAPRVEMAALAGEPAQEQAEASLDEWQVFGVRDPAPASNDVSTPPESGACDAEDLPALTRGVMHDFFCNDEAIGDVRHHWFDASGALTQSLNGAEGATLRIQFDAKRRIRRLVIGVPIWSEDGVFVTAFGTHGRAIIESVEPGVHRIDLRVPALRLNRGRYYPVVAIVDSTEFLYRRPTKPLDVLLSPETIVWGVVTLDYDWVQPGAANVA